VHQHPAPQYLDSHWNETYFMPTNYYTAVARRPRLHWPHCVAQKQQLSSQGGSVPVCQGKETAVSMVSVQGGKLAQELRTVITANKYTLF